MWYELAENPMAVSTLYSGVPELKHVRLLGLRLNNFPHLTLILDLPTFPDRAPARTKWQGCNAVSMELDFWAVKDVHIDGWNVDQVGDVEITLRDDGLTSLVCTGHAMRISALSEGFRIQHLSAYIYAPESTCF